MKRSFIISIVALAVLAAGLAAFGEEKGRGKGPGRQHHGRREWMHRMADANTPMDANSPWAQRRAEMRERAQKAFEARVGRLKKIRGIAAGEGATQTVEALDKLIGEVEEKSAKRQNRMEKGEGMWPGPMRMGRRPHGMRRGGQPMEEPAEEPTE